MFLLFYTIIGIYISFPWSVTAQILMDFSHKNLGRFYGRGPQPTSHGQDPSCGTFASSPSRCGSGHIQQQGLSLCCVIARYHGSSGGGVLVTHCSLGARGSRGNGWFLGCNPELSWAEPSQPPGGKCCQSLLNDKCLWKFCLPKPIAMGTLENLNRINRINLLTWMIKRSQSLGSIWKRKQASSLHYQSVLYQNQPIHLQEIFVN